MELCGQQQSVTYVNLSPGKYHLQGEGLEQRWTVERNGHSDRDRNIAAFLVVDTGTARLFCARYILNLYVGVVLYKEKQDKAAETPRSLQSRTGNTCLQIEKSISLPPLAHEIRTPLSLISAPLEEVISSGEGSKETHQNLSMIEKNCDRLTVLINQLLDFRKMDSTKYIVNPETINLSEHISELYERFKKTARTKR
jgi:Signal transduction histidine kinase